MSVLTRFRPSLVQSARAGLRFMSAAPQTDSVSGLPLKEGEPAPLPSKDKPLSPKVAALVDEIVNLSLLDVADLNKALKKRLNIADQPMMPAGMMMAAQAPKPAQAGV
ncbi:unnamed protein product [Cylicostephanus goldi]|uniref:Large ribosomal subunit protein bL12 oligomerization domain-containing protein n=1 Tax=Cylicostephanus goldi TaxID=71465 RepID=A0A3P7ND15_CYLGO|nr:unnamed protein product [Cylicostephanus goldi]